MSPDPYALPDTRSWVERHNDERKAMKAADEAAKRIIRRVHLQRQLSERKEE